MVLEKDNTLEFEVSKLDEITKDGISPEEVKQLQDIIQNKEKAKTLIEELKNGRSQEEINLIKNAITEEQKKTSSYKELFNELNNLKPTETPDTEVEKDATSILKQNRTPELAKALIETNETDFNKLVGELKDITEPISNKQLKKLCLAYSDKINNITGIKISEATDSDAQFTSGTKIIEITGTGTKTGSKEVKERFTFGPITTLVDRYKSYITTDGKLTANNLDSKFKIIEEDCKGASNADEYYEALAKQISGNKALEAKFLKLFIGTDGKVKTDMLKYLGTTKSEQLNNLNTISATMTDAQKKQIENIKTQINTAKFAEDLGSSDIMNLGLDAIKQKFGPVKGMLMKILNMINSNPMLRSMFGGFFDKKNGVEERLTEEYELSDGQKSIINKVKESLNTKKPIQNMETIIKDKNNIGKALTKNINFDDISPDFVDYMTKASTENKQYKNKDDLISDYMEMLEDKNSPLRKNYEESMKQLSKDAKENKTTNNADLIQIMTASILNFQQNGEGMKYLWTRNNKKVETQDETQENTPETPADQLVRETKEMLNKEKPSDKELITFYDKFMPDGKTLEENLKTSGMTKEKLPLFAEQLALYITHIKKNKLGGTYEINNLNSLNEALTTAISTDGEGINGNFSINILENLGDKTFTKPFPEDVKNAFEKLEKSNDITNDHTSMLKTLNTNFNETITHYKKDLLTGKFDTQSFLTLLAKTGDTNFTTKDKIENKNVKKEKSTISIGDNSIKIKLNKEDGNTEKTITITKGANRNKLPKFTIT